jgi:hypothetical protein
MKTISPKLVSFYFLFSVFCYIPVLETRKLIAIKIILISILKQQKKLRFLFRPKFRNKPIGGVVVQIYTQNPLTAQGLLKENSNDFFSI